MVECRTPSESGSIHVVFKRVKLDDKGCRLVLKPTWSNGEPCKAPPDRLAAYVFDGEYPVPSSEAVALEAEYVASREGSEWHPVNSYLLSTAHPCRFQATLQDGKLSTLEVRAVSEPPFTDFISPTPAPNLFSATPAPNYRTVQAMRWRTHILLSAKNKTLAKLLLAANTKDLTELKTKIEQAILDYTHNSEVLKDQAQRTIETGSQTSDPQALDQKRELALLCKEMAEILKSILAAVKEETANRRK